MSIFDDLDAELSSAMEDEFGDMAVFSPRVPSEYGAALVDPARPEKQVRGIYSSGPVIRKLDGDARGNQFNTKQVSEVLVFWISAAALAALGYDVRKDDQLTIAGKPKPFRVVAVMATDRGDVELHLSF